MFPAVSSILSAACSWSFDKVPKKMANTSDTRCANASHSKYVVCLHDAAPFLVDKRTATSTSPEVNPLMYIFNGFKRSEFHQVLPTPLNTLWLFNIAMENEPFIDGLYLIYSTCQYLLNILYILYI